MGEVKNEKNDCPMDEDRVGCSCYDWDGFGMDSGCVWNIGKEKENENVITPLIYSHVGIKI